MTLKETVREFLAILDEVEETDSGKEFHPVQITSCRVLKTKRIGELIQQMKEDTNE